MHPVIAWRELVAAGLVRLGHLNHLEEVAFTAFCSRLNDQNAARRHGRDGASDNFDGLLWEFGADRAEFRYVQAVNRAAAHRCGHADGAVVVGEQQLLGAGPRQREALPDFIGQMVIGKNNLVSED